MGKCGLCGKRRRELCGDLVCRSCHKSLTFEECVSGEWTKKQWLAAGLLWEWKALAESKIYKAARSRGSDT